MISFSKSRQNKKGGAVVCLIIGTSRCVKRFRCDYETLFKIRGRNRTQMQPSRINGHYQAQASKRDRHRRDKPWGIGMENSEPQMDRDGKSHPPFIPFYPHPPFYPVSIPFPSLSRSIPIPLFIPFLSLSPFCIIININTLQKFYCIFKGKIQSKKIWRYFR